MECFHSVPWDSNDKGNGGHVGIPNEKLIKIILYVDTNMAAMTSSANIPFTAKKKEKKNGSEM